jgi:hypothetical protein
LIIDSPEDSFYTLPDEILDIFKENSKEMRKMLKQRIEVNNK